MAVYAICGKCWVRREHCNQQTAHKRYTCWRADWQPSRLEGRLKKTYRWDLDNPKELAETQLRQWKTDHERGELRLIKQPGCFFGALADKYWREHAVVEGRHPERSTFYTVEKAKGWIGVDRKISPLTEDEIKQFQSDMRSLQRKLRAEGLAAATVNRYFNIIHSIFEKGREWGEIKVNPIEFVGRLQEDEPSVRFLEQKEIDKLFETVDKLISEYGNVVDADRKSRLRVFMTVLSHTGARPSSIEECNQDHGDVDMANRVLWFTTYKGGKKKKHRYPVPIDDELLPIVMKRVEETEGRGPIFDCQDMPKLTRQVVEQSGVNKGKPDNFKFTIYGLKHCYASHLIMNGASEAEVAELLGHTDTRMVHKHYKHLTLGHLRKIQGKINLTRIPELKVV